MIIHISKNALTIIESNSTSAYNLCPNPERQFKLFYCHFLKHISQFYYKNCFFKTKIFFYFFVKLVIIFAVPGENP